MGQIQVKRIEPAYRQVANQLRSLILQGVLAPGERLPNEVELSEQFGVSRSTVREALRSLASHNLLVTQRGVTGGSFIAHPEPLDISHYLETSVGLLSGARVVSVRELLEARAVLEVPATRMAAERRTDEHLEALLRAVEQEEAALDSGFDGHKATHAAILEAAGNSLIEMMTRPLFGVLRLRFLRDEAPPSFWADVCADHKAIVGCIVDRDGEGAARAMAEHLDKLAGTYEAIDALRLDGDGP
jgi:GntR family transcriptional regulator, transcriptional repressor for pyruvate dehydrogenase complex